MICLDLDVGTGTTADTDVDSVMSNENFLDLV